MATGVVIPVGGFAPYLAEALDGVLACGPAEVVVVDDAADPPVALHPDHRDRVRVVRRAARGGPAAARASAGLETELVALCDADDAWQLGHLRTLQAALADHPRAGMAFGRALVVGPDGRPTGETWAAPPAGPLALEDLYRHNPVPTSSVVLRRAALEDAGGFASPLAVAEDWDLWLRIARAGWEARCVPEAVVRYRRHPAGLTADVARLAAGTRAVHERHAAAVPRPVAARVLAADRRVRRRQRARELPGVRLVAGRRDPYRR